MYVLLLARLGGSRSSATYMAAVTEESVSSGTPIGFHYRDFFGVVSGASQFSKPRMTSRSLGRSWLMNAGAENPISSVHVVTTRAA